MKVKKESTAAKMMRETEHGMKITVNPELDKFSNVVLFPEKVSKAKESISRIDWNAVRRLGSGKKKKSQELLSN